MAEDERTVEELRERASELEIPGRSDMNKAELAKAVDEATSYADSGPAKPSAKNKTESTRPNVLEKILALEDEVNGSIEEYDDIIKAALNLVRGAISTIKDSLETHESLERPPPRDRGFTPEPATSTSRP